MVNYMYSLFIPYILGESCKCNLLTRDDYNSMIVSTLGEFIGKHQADIGFFIFVNFQCLSQCENM